MEIFYVFFAISHNNPEKYNVTKKQAYIQLQCENLGKCLKKQLILPNKKTTN